MAFYIGLMSGTSMDSVDAALCKLLDGESKNSEAVELLSSHSHPIPEQMKAATRKLRAESVSVSEIGRLDSLIGKLFADAANELLENTRASGIKIDRSDIRAIGSHGQTVFHSPNSEPPFTMQLGDPNVIATETGLRVVGDFRRMDVALGGQGAPLAPAFHAHFLGSPEKTRIVLNIGGIANVTVIPKQSKKGDAAENVRGWDTGPGNCLIDALFKDRLGKECDKNGDLARSGNIDHDLLRTLLEEPYFTKLPPKSTGTEYFNLDWLRSLQPAVNDLQTQDLAAGLTAQTIVDSILSHSNPKLSIDDGAKIVVCGGGAHNGFLMERLSVLAGNHRFEVKTSDELGLDPDWMEAMAFAWLAKRRLDMKPGNLPSVTGAKQLAVLGGIFEPPQ